MDFLGIIGVACGLMVVAGLCLMLVPIKTIWKFN